MRELIIATRSAGKLRELIPMLAPLGLQVLSLDTAGILPSAAEDVLEVFETFEENALAKARWFASLSGDRPVVADDSGLSVEAMDGGPGVRSKRWSGRDDLEGDALDHFNNQLLVRTLERSGALQPWRASYVCAAACAWQGVELVARGECGGVILPSPRGTEGFGYDPVFLSDELGSTFGESTRTQKEAVSHRGRAIRALVEQLVVMNLFPEAKAPSTL